ncbi:MAG: Kae1-associated kinase Bud32 [Desulfurococcaceae archaeon]|jgi:TP53 regulating kinase-like protein|nr:Kae1-associated kinase Bud32 [Desulfurococcaceae archaeon]
MDELVLIASGAEANLYRGRFLGYDVVVKHRVSKPYRDVKLDLMIRRDRTLTEAKIMLLAMSLGVRVPTVLYVDLENSIIVMEYVEGVLLRDYIGLVDEGVRRAYLELLGVYVGKLHKNDITHGDLTTSNVIVSSNGSLYIIDFGLSKISNDVEDKAVDIHLLMRSFESIHYNMSKELLTYFLRGYRSVLSPNEVNDILNTVKEIRLRGRYVEERRVRKS